MLKSFNLVLDLEKQISNPLFSISQNDLNSIVLNITIKQEGKILNLLGTTCKIAIKKPRGNTVFQTCDIIDAENGIIKVTLNTQAYIEIGTHSAEIYIYKDLNVSVTNSFSYISKTAILNDETIVSTNEWQAINEVINNINNHGSYTKPEIDSKLNEKSQVGHDHDISDITGLQNELNNKAPLDSPTFTGDVNAVTFWENGSSLIDKYAEQNHTHDFSEIENKPSSVAGYNILDVYTKDEVNNITGNINHTHDFDEILNRPTTIAGYEISDAYTKNEINSITGNLNSLTTTDKTNFVNAINEIKNSTGSSGVSASHSYVIELNRWGISNDGTNPINTTKGINDALTWASQQGYTYVKLPAGLYLIGKGIVLSDISDTAVVKLKSNMFFDISGCTLKKETNNWTSYYTVYGENITNSIIYGGKIQGDRMAHDYSNAGNIYEWCMGIRARGKNRNFIMDSLEICDFPGYSVSFDGEQYQFALLTYPNIESGKIDDSGVLQTDTSWIRTTGYTSITANATRLNDVGSFMITGNGYNYYGTNIDGTPVNLSNTIFNIYFYNDANTYLGKMQRRGFDQINVDLFPTGATKFKISFRYEYAKIIPNTFYLGLDTKTLSSGTIIRNCKIHDSFALGIAMCQTIQTTIEDNEFYNIGYALNKIGRNLYPFPMAIDIEDGYNANQHIVIRNNIFRDNQAMHVNIVQGRNILIEGNKFQGTGGVDFQGTKGSNFISRHNQYNLTSAQGQSATFVQFQNDHFIGANIQLRYENIYDGCVFDDMTFILQTDTFPNWTAGINHELGNPVLPTTKNGYYYVCTTRSGVPVTIEPTWPTSGTVTDSVGNVWTTYVYNPIYDTIYFRDCKFNLNRPEASDGWLVRRGNIEFDNCRFNVRTMRYFTDGSIGNDYAVKNAITFRNCDINVPINIGGVFLDKLRIIRTKMVGQVGTTTYSASGWEVNDLLVEDSVFDSMDIVFKGYKTSPIAVFKNNRISINKSARRFGATCEGFYLTKFDTLMIENNIITLPITNVDIRPFTIWAEKYLKFTNNFINSSNQNNSIELFGSNVTPVPTVSIFDNNFMTKFKFTTDISYTSQIVKSIGNFSLNMDVATLGSPYNVSALPTSGKFYLGQLLYNSTPVSAGYIGWVCTTAGVANNTAWAATTAYALNALVNVNNKVYKCTVAGTSSSTSPTHTTGTATDGTVTWQYIDALAVFKQFGAII